MRGTIIEFTQVDVLDLRPRPNPGKGNTTHGVTISGGIGWHRQTPPLNPKGFVDAVTVYEVITDEATGSAVYAEPLYQYLLEALEGEVPCHPTEGKLLRCGASNSTLNGMILGSGQTADESTVYCCSL